MYVKPTRPWLRFFAKEEPAGGTPPAKPDADALNKLVDGAPPVEAPPVADEDSEDDDKGESPKPDSEDLGDPKESWEEQFPELTPTEVQASIDEWKKRSRDWEKRSKENHTALEKLRNESGSADSGETDRLQGELHLYQDVIAYAIANGNSAHIPELVDSMSFRQAHGLLDREAEDYEAKLGDLITKRLGPVTPEPEKAPHQTGGTETYRDRAKTVGDQLYEELYGAKQ